MTILPAGASPAPGSPRARLLAAAHQLESVFYGQLFQVMRDTVPDSGLVPRDSGDKIFTSMLDDQVSRMASSQSHRGLADSIYRELSRRLPPDTPAPSAVPTSTAKPANE